MRYVQINSVPYGSTGGVMKRVHEARIAAGDESWMMWGRGRAATEAYEFNYGSRRGVLADAALTRLDGRAGFHSTAAAKHLLAKLDDIKPDVVHLHNVHGYHVNIEMLFAWLSSHSCLVRWTLHDCWAFTGHCAHFTVVGCNKWKDGCRKPCPQTGLYPKSFVDACENNYRDKKRIFTSIPIERMTIVTPSQWLADLVGESFLAIYPVEVHPNVIDAHTFKPTPSAFCETHGLEGKYIILGVASPWSNRKGWGDFIALRSLLDDRFAIVMVGLTRRQMRKLPEGIVGIEHVDNPEKMAEIYTAADCLFQPSLEETFGLTIAEAAACATTSLVYRGGACEETAHMHGGAVVGSLDEAAQLLLKMGGQR